MISTSTLLAALAVAGLAVSGCGTSEQSPQAVATSPTAAASPSSTAATEEDTGDQRYPDVVAAELERDGDSWRLSATLSSPYDSPERYADAFRALSGDGTVLGVRELLHDHAGEQPFTRSLDDLEIPEDVDSITVQGRDLEHGWGGDTVEVEIPR